MKKEKLYIIIPAYNESANIEEVINDWIPLVDKIKNESKLIVINDGSRDNTLDILKGLEKKHKNLVVIDKENSGHGATILYGYKYALDNDADYIFQTDSDGQTLASEFDEFWKKRNEYDVIIGHRNKRKDGISRIFVTKVLKYVLRLIFKVSIKDSNCPYRLMKKECLKKYIDRIPKDYNLTNVLLSVLFVKNKENVLFIPITFRPRQGGENSINIRKITKIGKKAIKDFKQLKKEINRWIYE